MESGGAGWGRGMAQTEGADCSEVIGDGDWMRPAWRVRKEWLRSVGEVRCE